MVGLVVASHSAELARAVAVLAGAVSERAIPVAHAGGVGQDRAELGTDATEILEAIESVFSDDGVLVLMDLGSALLSAETALEFADPSRRALIRLCAAPLVEGAVAAAVQIAAGATLDQVAAEAMDALSAKRDQLGDRPEGEASPTASATAASRPSEASASDDPATRNTGSHSRSRRFTVSGEHGIHARPAARFVQTVARGTSDVRIRNITNGKGPVNGRSMNRIATLGVQRGHQIEVEATGADADAVLAAIAALLDRDLAEPSDPTAPVSRQTTVRRRGPIGISEGYAIGPVFRLDTRDIAVPEQSTDSPEAELTRWQLARRETRTRIERRIAAIRAQGVGDEAAILEAHLLILDDPEIETDVVRGIRAHSRTAGYAWWQTVRSIASQYRDLDDEYMRQRATDVLDVGRQLLFVLYGEEDAPLPRTAVIVVAEELTPSQTAALPLEHTLALLTATGGPTSHSAVMARALGIPAVAGFRGIDRLSNGEEIAVDGGSGEVVVAPDEKVRRRFAALQRQRLQRQHEAAACAAEPALTRDGRRIDVLANVGEPGGALRLVAQGAEGVGVLRTEFMFLTRAQQPSEDEQTATISRVVTLLEGRPVTVRTLDIGGDKQLPYLPLPAEENPFLGVRGIRLCLEEETLFMPQLRAILRAALNGPVSLMIPMVSRLEEIEQVRASLELAHHALGAEGVDHAWPLPLGIMIETPAAALLADKLAPACDFFSIGSNDLTQYVTAAERGNDRLSEIADSMHPAVLRAISRTRAAAAAAGIPCSVCGEMAGTSEGAAALVGLGIDKLSMNGAAIGPVKALIRTLCAADLQAAATRALDASTAAEAHRAFRGLWPGST
ncbi:MAG: phosphoenolpyruvate--protein phosphotransferase [Spirochaetaceae bacterium]|nr:MAG: phosphoenolpyruvate--protein phosphotransferase [Spirochaetaceae bacterium]